MIRAYCTWDNWAMVAVKGEGRARSEQITHGVTNAADAIAEAQITLP